MAFIAKTAFEARGTNNENDILANVAGLYQESAANADCSAGLLCVRAGQTPVEGFPSALGLKNENTFYMNACAGTETANDVIYACNTYDNQLLPSPGGNKYFIGHALLGLGVPAGRYGNWTRINFDNQSWYRFGEGNVTVNTEGDQYFVIAAGGVLSSVTAKPATAGDIYFTLKEAGTGYFTEGESQSFGYYDLTACIVKA